ncbi:hypothetical protein CGZ98_19750 [Enemella evansiae]|uniref:serine hydrolase domain-containing protein n=1 Tax=Enemella evansiae TaxID=2016499 RepID=UPI000B96D0EA|nr:serine hydrolase domain-containing protein [Enemella evansiae]OYO07147.1 hypothetical protein CGZ98_19750 [Enemella evansiae]
MTDRSTTLPTASAAELGVRQDALEAFVTALEQNGVEVHGLAVVRRGHLVQLGAWTPWQQQRPTLAYSVSKTVTASCVGIAIGDGLLSLDDRLVEVLGPEVTGPVAPGVEQITVHQLLSMATGHTVDTLPAMLWKSDPIRAFCGQAPQAEPGSVFCYNNGATWLLGELVRRVTGERLVDFATRRFLAPLGITDLHWQESFGAEFGFSGCFLTVEQIAAIAELYRCDGVWQGERLLPEGWVERASREQISTAGEENAHSAMGYGYQLWRHPDGFRLDGAFAQYGIVLPEQEAVIAVTSGNFPSLGVMSAVLEHLQPGLAPLTDNPVQAGDPEQISGLEVPWPAGDGDPVGPVRTAGPVRNEQPAEALDQWWFPALADAAVGAQQGGWQLQLTLAGQPTAVDLGTSAWLTTELVAEQGHRVPVATRCRRDGATTTVSLAFIDTPHRLTLTLTEDGAVQRWNCPPLNGAPLAGLSVDYETVTPSRA